MNFQTAMLADLVRRERAAEASPRRLERRRMARLAEAIARCCRATVAGRVRDALVGAAACVCA